MMKRRIRSSSDSRELSTRLGITPAAATDLVDRLERAGHLERHRDGSDRRRVQLIPTSSALDRVSEELRPLTEALDSAAAGFTHSERAVLTRFLDEVTRIYADFGRDGTEPS